VRQLVLTHTDMAKLITLTITVRRTRGDRLRWFVGTAIMRLGALVIGFGQFRLRDDGVAEVSTS
jgi:hypothetical protein